MSDDVAEGGCLCGRVQFAIQLPTKWAAHCHCSMCRRAHGAAFVTWVGVEADHFNLVKGAEDLAWYASSKEARRGFCSHCGSTMLFESSRWADEVHIALGSVSSPIDRSPAAHAFFDTHVSWVHLDDGLKRLGGESGTEPLS